MATQLCRGHADGFTLTELLAYFGVIGVLLAIALPVLFTTRERGHRVACLQTVRQINIALLLYTGDNDGMFIPQPPQPTDLWRTPDHRTSWLGALDPYLKTAVLPCPSVSLPERLAALRILETAGYAYNYILGKNGLPQMAPSDVQRFQGFSEAAVPYPALTVSIFEARVGIVALPMHDYMTDGNRFAGFAFWLKGYESEIWQQPLGVERHNGGANYAFVDGHTRWLQDAAFGDSNVCDGKNVCYIFGHETPK